MNDVDPCAALGCSMQTEPVEMCRDHRCPHRWQREGREDRARRDEKDGMDTIRLKKGASG